MNFDFSKSKSVMPQQTSTPTTQSPTSSFDFYSEALARRALPSDPAVRADIEHVLEHGYVVIPNCFSADEAREARDEITRLLHKDSSGQRPLTGRNSFEGLNTNRIYSLLNKTRVFDKFVILPRVLALNDFFLDPGYLLSAYHTISINPGEKAQALHHDDYYIKSPRPRLPFGTAIMVALNEYTAENGATRVIPGSHKWDSSRRGTPEETIPALCPEGGVIYFIGTLWHGGGANFSDKPRQSATVQYCQPFVRPIENQILAVDPRKLDSIHPRIVDLMGYTHMEPFMGYADGMGPRRAARRMVKWLQEEVDNDPPTFAHGFKDSKL
ncbi:Phytanoyl-CoA dioxygenase family protein [Fonsecaea pedrosoi]|nr:Phytanoyl-CoA dioxygenase family protein [Fonsecaea pedrosoi]